MWHCKNSRVSIQVKLLNKSNCDGLEFELTSMKIDLRFVDDSIKFSM